MATQRFDVIHAHLHEGALIGLVLGRLFGLPVVFDFQGSLTEEMIDHHFLRRTSSAYPPLRKLEEWIDHASAAGADQLKQRRTYPGGRLSLRPGPDSPFAGLRRHDDLHTTLSGGNGSTEHLTASGWAFRRTRR
jgi:hypothetical protein